jgi:hypothetical protein
VPPVLCRSSGEGLKHSWAHVQPHYTTAAMDKALEEAMAFGEALCNPWNLKVRYSRNSSSAPTSLHSSDTTQVLPPCALRQQCLLRRTGRTACATAFQLMYN